MFCFFFLFLSRPWPQSWLGTCPLCQFTGPSVQELGSLLPIRLRCGEGRGVPPSACIRFLAWLHPDDSRNWLRRKDSHSKIPSPRRQSSSVRESPLPPAGEGRAEGKLPRAWVWPPPVLDTAPPPNIWVCPSWHNQLPLYLLVREGSPALFT